MYKKILVAVDGSPTGEAALEEAIRLAIAGQSDLWIVHAVELQTVEWDGQLAGLADLWAAFIARGRGILDKALTRAISREVTAHSQLIELSSLAQRIPEAIVAEADRVGADLIVVGTHGRRGLSRLFLGSVAEGITRVAHLPVLLVRGKEST